MRIYFILTAKKMSINFLILLYFQVAFNILIPENLAALFDTFFYSLSLMRSVKPKLF